MLRGPVELEAFTLKADQKHTSKMADVVASQQALIEYLLQEQQRMAARIDALERAASANTGSAAAERAAAASNGSAAAAERGPAAKEGPGRDPEDGEEQSDGTSVLAADQNPGEAGSPASPVAGRRRRRASSSGSSSDGGSERGASLGRSPARRAAPAPAAEPHYSLQRVLSENPRVLDLLSTHDACVLRRVSSAMRAVVADHPWCDLETIARPVAGTRCLTDNAGSAVRFGAGFAISDVLDRWARCFPAATGVCVYTEFFSDTCAVEGRPGVGAPATPPPRPHPVQRHPQA